MGTPPPSVNPCRRGASLATKRSTRVNTVARAATPPATSCYARIAANTSSSVVSPAAALLAVNRQRLEARGQRGFAQRVSSAPRLSRVDNSLEHDAVTLSTLQPTRANTLRIALAGQFQVAWRTNGPDTVRGLGPKLDVVVGGDYELRFELTAEAFAAAEGK